MFSLLWLLYQAKAAWNEFENREALAAAARNAESERIRALVTQNTFRCGTNKPVTATFWHWLEPFSVQKCQKKSIRSLLGSGGRAQRRARSDPRPGYLNYFFFFMTLEPRVE